MLKNKKHILAFACCFIIPFIILVTLGLMLGTWFDSENLMGREDYETYQKPIYQYCVYYSTIVVFVILDILVINLYRKQVNSLYKYTIVLIALVILFLLTIFFILSVK